jgi:C-terminal processing protease CtpA/Prc
MRLWSWTMPQDVIEQALSLLCESYLYPDKAQKAADAIRERATAGQYSELREAALAERLTEHLAELIGDVHLRVRYRPQNGPESEGDGPSAREREIRKLRQVNFGIAKVERLPGNVGHIDLRQMPDPALAGRAITAAMELIAHTDALIFDLRKSTGGYDGTVVLWHSYLFPDDETLLNCIEDMSDGETYQYWTLPYVPGERYLDRPVYVLTARRTFSAAEGFGYNLQALKRATVVGEVTRGGAHSTTARQITPTLTLDVSTGRSLNPVTGTNWEAVGVQPDIPVPVELALDVAYRAALEHVLAGGADGLVIEEAREALLGLKAV